MPTPMLKPDILHSEEHESSVTDTSGGSGSNIGSNRIVSGSGSGSSSSGGSNGGSYRGNIKTGIRGGSGAQTYNRSPATTDHPFDGSGNESNENHDNNKDNGWSSRPGGSSDYYEYKFEDVDLVEQDYEDTGLDTKKVEVPNTGIQDDSSKQVPLIISIVAGILIIIIIIILIILKCNSNSREISKIEEAKTYASLSQGPTMIVNGQNNGTVKAGDRRPVKKERKDVKEWYV